jgi:uncharacterized protein (TIRG00374 family)
MSRFRVQLPHSRLIRVLLTLPLMAAVAAVIWWRAPFGTIGHAFAQVAWEWVAVAIAFNLASVVVRALAWTTVIRQAVPAPRPKPLLVFSAFSVGLFANAVLPGRIGELARVAVLARKLPRRRGLWATLVGTVFAHRVFDLVPVLLLILYVVVTAKVPAWAVGSLTAVVGVGLALFAFAFASARRDVPSRLDGRNMVRRLVVMARQGLSVMRAPADASVAVLFQIGGWVCQIFAVWTAMRAFDIHAPLPAAGVVLLVMNVVTIFPFWPGNIGLLQVAIATALKSYGVAVGIGVAYGFGLQAIEASVGIGVGLLFLAREGLSFAILRGMPSATAEFTDDGDPADDVEAGRARTRAAGTRAG